MGHDGFGSDRLGRDGFGSATGSAAMGLAATGSAAADAAGGPSMQFLLQLVKGFLRANQNILLLVVSCTKFRW